MVSADGPLKWYYISYFILGRMRPCMADEVYPGMKGFAQVKTVFSPQMDLRETDLRRKHFYNEMGPF